MTAIVIRADARALPLPDACADLIVTSPPYFGLRSYTDGGEHYDGQIGSEATPREWLASLLACTREWVRVLKPSGSIFVNLGDKYNTSGGELGGGTRGTRTKPGDKWYGQRERRPFVWTTQPKSLLGLPWRYALACIDDLGLILRAEIIWAKPNGLPESVTDRVRRSHEQVFHFTRQPRYYAAVDEIRESYAPDSYRLTKRGPMAGRNINLPRSSTGEFTGPNPLGKLPGSVWDISSQPLTVPACRLVLNGRTARWFMTWREGHAHMRHLARYGWDGPGRPSLRPEAQHFAAFPMELPRRIILGWSPPGVCTTCGEGRRPVVIGGRNGDGAKPHKAAQRVASFDWAAWKESTPHTITGYACACPEPSAPTRPAVVLDPFAGTGTTMLVASTLGRIGIGVDRSADYCRLAAWRTTDPGERARAMQVPKPPPVTDGQCELFGAGDL